MSFGEILDTHIRASYSQMITRLSKLNKSVPACSGSSIEMHFDSSIS